MRFQSFGLGIAWVTSGPVNDVEGEGSHAYEHDTNDMRTGGVATGLPVG